MPEPAAGLAMDGESAAAAGLTANWNGRIKQVEADQSRRMRRELKETVGMGGWGGMYTRSVVKPDGAGQGKPITRVPVL
jgi:hypothetical protein